MYEKESLAALSSEACRIALAGAGGRLRNSLVWAQCGLAWIITSLLVPSLVMKVRSYCVCHAD